MVKAANLNMNLHFFKCTVTRAHIRFAVSQSIKKLTLYIWSKLFTRVIHAGTPFSLLSRWQKTHSLTLALIEYKECIATRAISI